MTHWNPWDYLVLGFIKSYLTEKSRWESWKGKSKTRSVLAYLVYIIRFGKWVWLVWSVLIVLLVVYTQLNGKDLGEVVGEIDGLPTNAD